MAGDWYVEVRAHPASILDLEMLAPNVRFVEVAPAWAGPGENRLSVTSEDWTGLTGYEEAHAAAEAIVGLVAAKLTADSALHPRIELGSSIWLSDPASPAGYRRNHVLKLESGVLTLTGGPATVLRNGFEEAPPRTIGQRTKELSASKPEFAAALNVFEHAGEDLARLHIVLEYVRKRSGYAPERFAPKGELAAFAETANNRPNIRHVGGDRANVHPPMPGAEGRELMRLLLLGWLDADQPF